MLKQCTEVFISIFFLFLTLKWITLWFFVTINKSLHKNFIFHEKKNTFFYNKKHWNQQVNVSKLGLDTRRRFGSKVETVRQFSLTIFSMWCSTRYEQINLLYLKMESVCSKFAKKQLFAKVDCYFYEKVLWIFFLLYVVLCMKCKEWKAIHRVASSKKSRKQRNRIKTKATLMRQSVPTPPQRTHDMFVSQVQYEIFQV